MNAVEMFAMILFVLFNIGCSKIPRWRSPTSLLKSNQAELWIKAIESPVNMVSWKKIVKIIVISTICLTTSLANPVFALNLDERVTVIEKTMYTKADARADSEVIRAELKAQAAQM